VQAVLCVNHFRECDMLPKEVPWVMVGLRAAAKRFCVFRFVTVEMVWCHCSCSCQSACNAQLLRSHAGLLLAVAPVCRHCRRLTLS
jgi:hypothetical protein